MLLLMDINTSKFGGSGFLDFESGVLFLVHVTQVNLTALKHFLLLIMIRLSACPH